MGPSKNLLNKLERQTLFAVRKQLHKELPHPHIGRVTVEFGMPKQVDGDVWQARRMG
jgi:hypothetical protein